MINAETPDYLKLTYSIAKKSLKSRPCIFPTRIRKNFGQPEKILEEKDGEQPSE